MFKPPMFMEIKSMSKKTKPEQTTGKSKKKIILIGTVFIVCALLLRKDAH